jgi:AraC family transcriptional regulator
MIYKGKEVVMDWISTIQKAINFIEDHLTDKISVDDVAKEVAISSFYLQKCFKILTDITISDYLKSRRLSLAGEELSEGNKKIIDIAYKYGYDTPESFTKAFYRFHGITPVKAKTESYRLKQFQPLIIRFSIEGGTKLDYHIERKPKLKLYGVQRTFLYDTAYQEIPRFWTEILSASGAHKDSNACGMFGVSLDQNDEKDSFQYYIADIMNTEKVPRGFEPLVIPEAHWAVFPCFGPMPYALQNVNTRIFKDWLPSNPQYEVAFGTYVEMYSVGDTTASNYYSEIWIPIQEKRLDGCE